MCNPNVRKGHMVAPDSPKLSYSLRRKELSYSGPLVQVRRASDNTIFNVGYKENNDLDNESLTYFSNPVKNDWDMTDINAGFITDTISSIDLTSVNNPTDIGTSIEFNGVDQYLERVYTPVLNLSVFYFHIRCVPYVNSGTNTVVASRSDTGGQRGWFLRIGSSIQFFTSDGVSAFQSLTHSHAVIENEELSIQAVYDGVNKYLTVNGVTETNSQVYSPNTNENFRIGAGGSASANEFFSGSVSEASLHDIGGSYVQTWYDQKNTGRDLVQNTNSSQPEIVSTSGVLHTSDGNKPAMVTDGVNDFLETQLFSQTGATDNLFIWISCTVLQNTLSGRILSLNDDGAIDTASPDSIVIIQRSGAPETMAIVSTLKFSSQNTSALSINISNIISARINKGTFDFRINDVSFGTGNTHTNVPVVYERVTIGAGRVPAIGKFSSNKYSEIIIAKNDLGITGELEDYWN